MPRRLSIRPPVAYDECMNRGGFSLARLLGVSTAKARLSRQIGIPLLLALSLPAALIAAVAW